LKITKLIFKNLFLTCVTSLVSLYSFSQLQFTENKGQWEKAIDYKSDIQNGAFFLQRAGFTVLLQNTTDLEEFAEVMHGHIAGEKKILSKNTVNHFVIRSHAYQVNFLNASSLVEMQPDKALPTYANYFIGNDSSKWKGNCKLYQAVTYKNMYPNIDIRYYTNQGTLKYDIIVHPGGNISDIALQYKGADKLSIKNKELVIATSVGEVKELYPYTYQVASKARETLDCKYVIEKNIVRFIVNNYNKNATLVIDPTLIFCTFTGSTKDNWGYTATPGPDGSLFAGGISFGPGFPSSLGAFQEVFNGGVNEDSNGGYDIAIIKLSADGTKRIYATYLGGSANEQPHSLIADAQGNLIIAGRSNSTDFPTTNPLNKAKGGYDIFVTKLNAKGSALIGSILIGGAADDGVNIKPKYISIPNAPNPNGAFDTRRNYGDDARSEVILGSGNTVYLASCTQSPDFPINGFPVIQGKFGGGGSSIQQDGLIMQFSADLSSVIFSTFFGGSGNDACFVLSLNPKTGNLYVAGGTTSTDLPGNKTGVLASTFQGGEVDGFVTEITPNGTAIIRTTYIGTNDNDPATDGNDLVYGIKFDKFGFPYIMGTTSGNWLAANAVFNNPGGKQFICKLQPDLSGYVYTTMFGDKSTVPNISPTAFLVDRCQNVYVSGWGGIFNSERGYPCAGTSGLEFLVTPGAIKSRTDGKDFFFFVLEKNAVSQLFGSFFGQNGGFDDHVDGGTSRFDENGIIYQAICANCGNTPNIFFPTTPGVWAPNNLSVNCNEAAVKIEMNFGGVGASVKATINGIVDTIGCVPLTVKFTDTLAKGKSYIWRFGDNTPDVITVAPNNSVSHQYNSVGTFKLMLISIDSTTCNISDTAYVFVKVGNNIVTPQFSATKIGGCKSLTFQFVNSTTAVIPIFKSTSFLWNFGDNSPLVRAGKEMQTHTYPGPGTYKVTLVVDDTTFCNFPDSIIKTVRLAVNVKAQFITPDKGCVPYTAQFNNTTLGGTDFIWNFGDNSAPSTSISPNHLYTATGTYIIKLIAIDTFTCNISDTFQFQVSVYPIPTAFFTFSPPVNNTPVDFVNGSFKASSYVWDFGDGETSTQANPRHLFNESKTYNVCLIAINDAGCTDTVCKQVTAKVIPLLDLPNAFTPGKFGVNGIIKVSGFGIGKMDWKIYNRWGQLVFASTDRMLGWDGTYKGALQPMDVYTYTLDVAFTDGKTLRKTGDITLLR
jgi:gliding motility-associated-like protein